jgi:hypothetical protein
MPDYSQGKIYRLICNLTGEQYIGSTTQSLAKRLGGHVATTKCEKNQYPCKSKQIIDRCDYSIVLIEEYSCDNKNQLEMRERFFIESMDCVNKTIPTRTPTEWYQENKEKQAEHSSKWNQANPEKHAEYNRKWRQANLEKHAEYNRKWRQANLEKNAEYKRKYYLKKKAEHSPAYRVLQDASMNTLLATLEPSPPMQPLPSQVASSYVANNTTSAGDV